ncbi:aldo/keto reductase [Nocardia mexicana]|uniref:Aryl-alcohol dehydrogenase-like predicted oxidoreductase n=1 Tax=Nocardia mexicana TaxID=279262 RepID=A0A370H853_9NOCA|nr:aldo/keto reductase [Nocardia mexicana]RDI52699.1 aryl-alcohol dehydrogenase-like predicted oxidoreductase [Nocardia mexicana]
MLAEQRSRPSTWQGGALDSYRLLGRSGLRVSPLALGTMTFGTEWGWGSDKEEARAVFDAYVTRGGNFFDTANRYTAGTSEEWLGEFAAPIRESLVLATKYTGTQRLTDPNSGGNHRKSLVASVESSLRRLRTDYLDLLYVHMWDGLTPVEEILRGLDDLVRAGKVLYVGISNTPAWQIARMQTIADLRGWSPLVALQIEYNLLERTAERELVPMASELGLGVIPWSPLASGVLTGKYGRADLTGDTDACRVGSRRNLAIANDSLTDRGLAIADVVTDVADQLGRTPAQVALAWTLRNPAVTAPLLGARTLGQLEDNLGALDLEFDDDHLRRLHDASAVDLGYPHDFLDRPAARSAVFGDTRILR